MLLLLASISLFPRVSFSAPSRNTPKYTYLYTYGICTLLALGVTAPLWQLLCNQVQADCKGSVFAGLYLPP